MPEVFIGKIEERGASRSTPATLHRFVMHCLFGTLTRRRSGVRIPVAGTTTYSISTVLAGRRSRDGSVDVATYDKGVNGFESAASDAACWQGVVPEAEVPA